MNFQCQAIILQPGNRNQLTDQCLFLINSFTEDLSSSVENALNAKPTALYANLHPSFTDNAERALIRQYNEAFHIRRMMSEPPIKAQMTQNEIFKTQFDANQNLTYKAKIERAKQNMKESILRCKQTLKNIFGAIPGIHYMFGETELAKTAFTLSNSQIIVWIVHGLTTICCLSIHEDRYGVVQLRLGEIIKSFLRLKLELDKLHSINLNGKKFDQNLNILRNSIMRNLYQIGNVFGDYFRDIIDDPEDLQNLPTFLCHRNCIVRTC